MPPFWWQKGGTKFSNEEPYSNDGSSAVIFSFHQYIQV